MKYDIENQLSEQESADAWWLLLLACVAAFTLFLAYACTGCGSPLVSGALDDAGKADVLRTEDRDSSAVPEASGSVSDAVSHASTDASHPPTDSSILFPETSFSGPDADRDAGSASPCPLGGTSALCGSLPYCHGPSYCLTDQIYGGWTVASTPTSCLPDADCSCLASLPMGGCGPGYGGACAPDPHGGTCARYTSCSDTAVLCCGGEGC